MSPQRVTQMVDLWREQLPHVKPFYAVKCNPDPHLLHHLYDTGLGFDCASKRELLSIKDLARSQAALTDRILYANPCKSEHDIRAAEDMDSPPTVVDSVEEVEKLTNYKGGAYIRIAVDDRHSTMPFSTKFGAPVNSVVTIGEAAKAQRLPIHGISFHVGSGCMNGRAYQDSIYSAYTCILNLNQKVPKAMIAPHTIDIGGGYLPNRVDFKTKSLYIREAMIRTNKVELEADRPAIQFVAEPGRFFATSGFDFFVQVIGKKESSSHGWSYTIDDSIYGQFTSVLFDQARPLWIRVQGEGPKRTRRFGKGVIFGRTCDSVDVITMAERMEELEVGDWLWFPKMGAYTHATASDFNGFPKPEIFVDDGAASVNHRAFHTFTPKGLHYMPPVLAAQFWARARGYPVE